MKMRKKSHQEDLFGPTPGQALQRRIKELDVEIASAMKRKEFDKARELTLQQEGLLREMVSKGDAKHDSASST